MSRLGMLAFCVVVSVPAIAMRIEFEVISGTERLPESEICFQKSASTEDPFNRWFASTVVRCLPADAVLDFPKGQWNYFARHSDGFISARPQLVNIDEAEREAGYRKTRITVTKAGVLDTTGLKVAPDEDLFVYFPNWQREFGASAQPVPRDQRRILVPAGEVVIPVVTSRRKPVRIMNEVTVAAGETVRADESQRKEPPTDLVAWIRVDTSSLRGIGDPHHLDPFIVEVWADGVKYTPLFPILDGAASHLTLLIFRSLPAGPATLTLKGGRWTTHTLPVNIKAGVVNIIESALKTGVAKQAKPIAFQQPTTHNSLALHR